MPWGRCIGVCLSTASLAMPAAAQGPTIHDRAALTAPDPTSGDLLGASVAADGPLAIAGAIGDDALGADAGAAYVFESRSGRVLAKLTAGDGSPNDQFGGSVAIDGTIALVGARFDDERGSASGSVYVFDLTDPEAPVQLAKLLAPDGSRMDQFGQSMAISGPLAVVGAWGADAEGSNVGAAYLFDLSDPRRPVPTAVLRPGEGETGDLFAHGVDISGTTVAVGALGDDDAGIDAGAVYLFDATDPNRPVLSSKLVPEDARAGDRFGAAVAIDGPTLLAGAWGDDDRGRESGSAYLFDALDPARPALLAKIVPRGAQPGDRFGLAVAIDAPRALIGSPDRDALAERSGAVYLLNVCDPRRPRGIARLLPREGAAMDRFGTALTVANGLAVVGVRHRDAGATRSGAAHVFEVGSAHSADLSGPGGRRDARVTTDDFLAFLSLFAAGDDRADLTGPARPGVADGDVRADDFFHYLDLYARGCS